MRILMIGMILMISIVQTVHAKVFLVSVGVADYPGTKNDLRVSDNDAKTIAKIFSAAQNASVNILVNENATRHAILSTLRTSFSHAQSSDAVILYFSGHGLPGALVCYDNMITYQSIFNLLKTCKANRKIIIADACFSGKMRTSKKHSTDYSSQNVMLFLSSRTKEESQETPFENSLFTIFLDRGLRGGADINHDKQITARELYDFVHNGVVEASKGSQHPVMWGKFDNNMTVIKW